MNGRKQKSEIGSQKSAGCLILLTLLAFATPGQSEDFAALCADRTAIERVYHAHRLGEKLPFEQTLTDPLIGRLVRDDLRKEAALKNNYAVDITPALLEAEVARINATTRAPEILTEIKHALGDDLERFARAMARPILVERELRSRFDNDDALHAPQRARATQARENLLAGQTVGEMHEVTWQLTPRPAEETPPPAPAPSPTKGEARSSAYAVEATAQLSQVLAAPGHNEPGQEKFYFEDLDPELQKVLRAQLQKAGDVSAVIETPGGFLVFVAKEKTGTTLCVDSLSIPKRSYEEWLARQPEDKP